MESEKTPENEQHFRIVTEICSSSKPHTVNIIKTVKKNQKSICCSESLATLRISLLITFLVSSLFFIMMWFTEIYNNTLLSNLVLYNNSMAVEWWANPPLNPYLRISVFNYTNYNEYMNGDADKLILKEVGPLVYSEKVIKTGIVFNPNGTITYQEQRIIHFLEHLSAVPRNATVIVPNFPLLSAFQMIQYEGFFAKITTRLALIATGAQIFKVTDAESLVWGYNDALTTLIKTTKPSSMPLGKFGILANRNGTSSDLFNINTGENDITQLNKIEQLNGRGNISSWSIQKCNEINGTDGSQFPPNWLDKKQPLDIYIKDMCRKFPLEYREEVNLFEEGIPAWRYTAKKNMFGNPSVSPENACYCGSEPDSVCTPSGIFNASICNFNAPVMMSFPHFLGGEQSLYKKFEGLRPVKELHQTYADVHPRLAFPIFGASRFQVNIRVNKKSIEFDGLQRFDDGDILPVLWFELIPGEISEELINLIYHSSFSANAVQIGLEYGSLILGLTSLLLLLSTYFCCDTDEHEKPEKEKGNNLNAIYENATINANGKGGLNVETIKV